MAKDPREYLGSRGLVILASLVVIVAGLKAAQSILVPIVVSVFLAILGLPALLWLQRKRIPTPLAVLIVILSIVAFLGGIGTLVGGSLDAFVAAVPRYQSRLEAYTDQFAPSIRGFLERGTGSSAVRSFDDVTTLSLMGDADFDPKSIHEIPTFNLFDHLNAGAIMAIVGGTLKGLAAVLSNTLLVILTMTFILLEAAGIPSKMRAALNRPDADLSRFNLITTEVQRYLAIKTCTSLGTGIILGIWCAILGVDFPLLWGLVAFLLNFIPALGSIIAAIPPIILALVQSGSIGTALVLGLGYLVVNVFIGNILEPNLFGRQLGLSPLVVFLSLVFWGWVWGPVGMLISVPLTMILKILLENTEEFHWLGILLGSAGAARQELRRHSTPHSQAHPATPPPNQPDGT